MAHNDCRARPACQPCSTFAARTCKPNSWHSTRSKVCGVQRAVGCAAVSNIQTPHSGFHLNTAGRFMEGWYFKVALPDTGEAVALIYSYEQGLQPDGAEGRLGMQAMGPGDTYAAQCSTNTEPFWADRNQLRLGACFKPTSQKAQRAVPKAPMLQAEFDEFVAEGFQATESWHQGCLMDRPDTCLDDLPSDVPWVKWAFSVKVVYGWGSVDDQQRSTAGWLASLPVLEPHWQVLVSHGVASGYIEWGPNKRLDFQDAPFYSEKNWGNGFPQKWAWLQCNTFQRRPDLAITAVGARRNLLNVPGLDEAVGLLGIHFGGTFLELEPATSEVSWRATPWGSWRFAGKNDRYEAVAEATCKEEDGQTLRAPTGELGLVPVCKDSFAGHLRLRVWQLTPSGIRDGSPIIDETCNCAAVEVGGGPWWGEWSLSANMNPAVAAATQLPLERIAARLGRLLPADVQQRAKPPGY